MPSPRYIIGIDLGTTNTALSYVDTRAGDEARPQVFAVPQVVQQGQVEERELLPSFLYLPNADEIPAGSLKLPWNKKIDYAVGEFARNFGSQVPTRLVSSAKSWLCHPGIDRRAAVLPWKAPEGGKKVSPLEASTRYLKHLADAWNHALAKDAEADRLENQDIVLTVPASFDAAARELTVEAARAAGFENLTLLEEPQAAFYAWLDAQRNDWRQLVQMGDLILVVDVGGGTTDLTLIEVGEEHGNLVLTRVAVGDHLLLGGDNMDLTLAHAAAKTLGGKLDLGQMLLLGHSCRTAKEQIFADEKLASATVTVLGRGRSVIGGTLRTELKRADVEALLVDGFFPECPLESTPTGQRSAGLQEIGLPYVSDPAVTRHLAYFLKRQADALAERDDAKNKRVLPNAVLFNGGVFKAEPFRQRLMGLLNRWPAELEAPKKKSKPVSGVRALAGTNLDLAVARGAAYYGLVRRGKGVRIRGGTARSYYVGVETSLPAVPGAAPPIKALCVAPFGMEEGTETDLPKQEFGLIIGEPVQFRFLGSTVRRQDTAGTMVEEWEGQIEELQPVSVTLEEKPKLGRTVPVHLHAKVTEVGQLELACISRDGKHKWKLEFNVREGK
ncbi:MAG TPA: Hsp70 family protein [Gemmataceae bacterium]|nr:Hsp70 family protein [Gemmataceae bacterium]